MALFSRVAFVLHVNIAKRVSVFTLIGALKGPQEISCQQWNPSNLQHLCTLCFTVLVEWKSQAIWTSGREFETHGFHLFFLYSRVVPA